MKEIIKSFAVETLGCGCGSEVFEKIEIVEDDLGSGMPGCRRILIGEKLLIYIVPGDDRAGIAEKLEFLLLRGKDERDKKGYNRFRLVFAVSDPSNITDAVNSLARPIIGSDEKLHVHVLSAGETRIRAILKQ